MSQKLSEKVEIERLTTEVERLRAIIVDMSKIWDDNTYLVKENKRLKEKVMAYEIENCSRKERT